MQQAQAASPPHTRDWIILIPAKNELATVAEVVREIRQHFGGTVLVVDDASTDGTGEAAREAGAHVIRLPFSLGAWGATQTGLRYALRHGYHAAITMDADGQHQADSLPVLQHALSASGADVVIGANPERGSASRRVAWHWFRSLSGLSLRDLTSGLRAYNRHAIRLLASSQATLLDYQDMGVLMLLHAEGLRIEEVAVPMNLRSAGHSRIFNTWWAVSKYMLHTSILCIARSRRRPHQRRRPSA